MECATKPHRTSQGVDTRKSPSLDEEMAPDSKTMGFKVEANVSNTHKNIQVHVKLVHIDCDKKYHVLITVAETEPYSLFRWGNGYSCEDPLKRHLAEEHNLGDSRRQKGLVVLSTFPRHLHSSRSWR